MNLPLIVLAFFQIAFFVGLAVGMFLIGFAVAGRREGIDIRCRRCRYEFARGKDIPPVCTECGTDLSRNGALILGRYRLRTWPLIAGITFAVVLPAGTMGVFFTAQIGSSTASAATAGTVDEFVDKAIAGDDSASVNLSMRLLGPRSPGTDLAWRDAARRLERDSPSARAILKSLLGTTSWIGTDTLSFNASDEVLTAFGEALARMLKADPSILEASLSNRASWNSELVPPPIRNAILDDPEALRTFLRGPVLQVTVLTGGDRGEAAGAGANGGEQSPAAAGRAANTTISPILVHPAFAHFGREFVIVRAEASYKRTDGTSVPLAPERGRGLMLDPTFGTRMNIGPALADPAWNGEVSVRGRIGTVASTRGPSASPIVNAAGDATGDAAEQFDHAWTIRVRRRDVAEVRSVPSSDAAVNSLIHTSLLRADVRTQGVGQELVATILTQVSGRVNDVHVRLRGEILQDGRSWSEVSQTADASSLARARAANFVLHTPGFDPTKPFQLILRGVPPEAGVSGPADHFHASGTWIVEFDRTDRPPVSVERDHAKDAPSVQDQVSVPDPDLARRMREGEVVRE